MVSGRGAEAPALCPQVTQELCLRPSPGGRRSFRHIESAVLRRNLVQRTGVRYWHVAQAQHVI